MSYKLNYLDKKGLAKVFSLIKFGHKKIWHGTLAEWEALDATEKAKYDQAEVIDEYTGVPVVVDKVEEGNLNPVTSNAVYGAMNEIKTYTATKSWNANMTNQQFDFGENIEPGYYLVGLSVTGAATAGDRLFHLQTFDLDAWLALYHSGATTACGGTFAGVLKITSDNVSKVTMLYGYTIDSATVKMILTRIGTK